MGGMAVQHVETFNPVVMVEGALIKYKGLASIIINTERHLIFDLGKEKFVIKSDNHDFMGALEVYALTEPIFDATDLRYFFSNIFPEGKDMIINYNHEVLMSHEVESADYVRVLSSTTYYPYCDHEGEYVKTFYVQVYDKNGHTQPFNFYCRKVSDEVIKHPSMQMDISIERILYLLARIEGFNDISIPDFYDYFCGLGDCKWFYETYKSKIIHDRNYLTRGVSRLRENTIYPMPENQLVITGSLSNVISDIIKSTAGSDRLGAESIDNVNLWVHALLDHVTDIQLVATNASLFGEGYDNRDALYNKLTSISALTADLAHQLTKSETKQRVLDF